MEQVNTSSVTRITEYDDRGRRVSQAVAARRRLHDQAGLERRGRVRTGGRAWINGSELGGTDPRIAHLGLSFD
jgi:hypothetical protein